MVMAIEHNGQTYYDTKEASNFLGVSRQTLLSYHDSYGLIPLKRGLSPKNYYKLTELQRIKEDRESFK